MVADYGRYAPDECDDYYGVTYIIYDNLPNPKTFRKYGDYLKVLQLSCGVLLLLQIVFQILQMNVIIQYAATNAMHEVKKYLSSLKRSDIRFHEPHFSNRLTMRDGSRDAVISMILDPTNLTEVRMQNGRYGDDIYVLCFSIGHRTIMLPSVITKQGLYIITYIDRHRGIK